MAPRSMDGVFLLGSEGEGDILPMNITYLLIISNPMQKQYPEAPAGVIMYNLGRQQFHTLRKAILSHRARAAKKAAMRCGFNSENLRVGEEKWYVIWGSDEGAPRQEISERTWPAIKAQIEKLSKAKDETGDDAVDRVSFKVEMEICPGRARTTRKEMHRPLVRNRRVLEALEVV